MVNSRIVANELLRLIGRSFDQIDQKVNHDFTPAGINGAPAGYYDNGIGEVEFFSCKLLKPEFIKRLFGR